jgi:3-methylcrotonyl-CoA carboxylase alpha subunit
MLPKRFVVRAGGDSRTVDIDAGGRVTVNGSDRQITIEGLDLAEYELSDGVRRHRVFVAGGAETREVFIDGRVFRFEVTSGDQPRRKSAASHGDTLTAPMPGTVVKVLVAPGQQVRRGDVLMKLEAMKMELPVRAPHDGSVKAVHCNEGELVQAGVRLLDLG